MSTRATLTASMIVALSISGCMPLPEEGDPCDGIEESLCESASGPGLFACIDNMYIYLDCSDLCDDDTGWSGTCGLSEDRGHDVCWCNPDSGSWGACTSESTGVCVAMNFGSSSNPSTARSEWLASCADTSDGDVGVFSA